MALLELRDVGAHYGEIVALRGVSLSLEEADVLAVLGANGAGKTTLLRAITGAVKSDGEVFFEDERLYRRTPDGMARRGVLHLAEGVGIFPRLSVLDNLQLGAWVHRSASSRDLARVYETFPFLYDALDRRADALSAGDQRLLALGRALMAKPRLLLADEPARGVAPDVVRDVFEALHAINARGAAVIVVDQHTKLAVGAASQTLTLDAGTPV